MLFVMRPIIYDFPKGSLCIIIVIITIPVRIVRIVRVIRIIGIEICVVIIPVRVMDKIIVVAKRLTKKRVTIIGIKRVIESSV